MKANRETENRKELAPLCASVRELSQMGQYEEGEKLICEAMMHYPHAAEPHNLLGVLLEKEGRHLEAMRHFRAAWALDPSYRPAKQNLDCFGTFYSAGGCAFDESDCPPEDEGEYILEYDERHIGHAVRRH